jgi:hypothetical protein
MSTKDIYFNKSSNDRSHIDLISNWELECQLVEFTFHVAAPMLCRITALMWL